MEQLSEKPSLGLPSFYPASLPVRNVPQSSATLGLSWSLVSRTRQSALEFRGHTGVSWTDGTRTLWEQTHAKVRM